ncbi:HK97 family phage prohead protease [Sphingobium sp. JS3065]|uniref:HK97 family phage prohead protease n=1 Tax=Sphingobium sp. JS3065 TaxID=2970925 RepID=UPI002263FFD2|nr:HK97 family phage prohead protease [Sphingobium sp. JS3065]UZW54049.1 HK97 family phage prohead protease [Sphingobium sp. JS3065]
MSNLARAYSFIEIKAADDDRRIIEGVATTPTPDRSQDIVRPMGAKFSLPLPFLWQHRHDEPVGHVIDADPRPSGIRFKAQIEKTDEPGKLKDRLDEAWLSLKLKLVRATSIGFRPLKYSFIENGGIDFEEWDWLELSGVTIPANPDAAITAVKQFDRILREAQGIPDLEILPSESPAAPGKSRVVKLDDAARVRAKPFVINRIVRS